MTVFLPNLKILKYFYYDYHLYFNLVYNYNYENTEILCYDVKKIKLITTYFICYFKLQNASKIMTYYE